MNNFKCNPYDELDYKIRNDFLRTYSLQLNNIYYSIYGIIDDYLLVSLIGESPVFNVFLGYKEGLFSAVKILKRSIYESKDVISERIKSFYHELQMRETLKELKFLPIIFEVNYEKFIIYEEFCNNGGLDHYYLSINSEDLIRTIINQIVFILKSLKEYNIEHLKLSLDNILFDKNYNLKVIGFNQMQKNLFISEKSNESQDSNMTTLFSIIAPLVFKENYSQFKNYFFDYSESSDYSLEIILNESLSNTGIITFIKNLKYLNSFEKIYDCLWLNTTNEYYDYLSELNKIRSKSLSLHYEEVFKKEQRLLKKKTGVFELINYQ